ncbi:MAG: YgiQ family radical SAM protein [Halorhodospira sp.]
MTHPLKETPPLFSYRQHWAACLGVAPFLPMSPREMGELGWDRCDIILVTGDAYVDHPSFGMALVGRLLEAQGFRVGIIAQPDWRSTDDFRALGAPRLFFGVTAGNMDSMVNRYTADGRLRSNDAYSPDDEGGRRPDRATIVYSQRLREAYHDTPIILGGIEASLRRLAHYDYWSDKVRRSVLLDAKADLLLYGNAERALVEVAHRLAAGEPVQTIRDLRGIAYVAQRPKEETADSATSEAILRLPDHASVRQEPAAYARMARIIRRETNPYNARTLVQGHGAQEIWVTPPPMPLSTEELDAVYELPYARAPHPAYAGSTIPAWEMIRFSVSIMRGCFGGCTFCSITEHEGRFIQSRSQASILREIDEIRERTEGFTGVISDLGGPSANMYRMGCKDPAAEARCRRMSCLAPSICRNLETNHEPLIDLYRQAREHPGVKKVLIASGVRYDLAIRSKAYVRELVSHHVGGYLKIAPEHTEPGPLAQMLKPGMAAYDRFKALFEDYSRRAGKEQYLIPYFIAAHPGTTDEDMLELSRWLKHNGFRPNQVQAFLPTPMALATAMYHTGRNPLKPIGTDGGERVTTAQGLRKRRLHKAFLRYHDPENWPLLRRALREMGRAELIGNSKRHLVPAYQPAGTGGAGEGRRRAPGTRGHEGGSRLLRAPSGKGSAGKPRRRPHPSRPGRSRSR